MRSQRDLSLNGAARLAGLGYLVIFFTAIYAEAFVRTSLVISGDAAATVKNISENMMLFRSGVMGYLIAAIFDVIVAYALYIVFKQFSKNLSLLAAWLRLIHAIIFALVLNHLFAVIQLTSDAEYLKALSDSVVQAQVMLSLEAYNTGWLIGLVFFGLHLILLGYLIIKSAFVPRLIGGLLILAGLVYIIDSSANFLMSNYAEYQDIFLMIVAIPAVVGELSFSLWLLINGVNLKEYGHAKENSSGGKSSL